ncbi:C2 family cysteine protease [Acetobacter cibinongensis]|uniref:Calpain catalytic domain-containing protein n=1 Tax=Acetobacter cibinongensis TaxID=146475 RepID=A0A1Z5YT36_9PROT|nr:C2 family cysteine protease [Acetobacter cibinongensis]OUJ01423.1 hypothetical protein HK14_09655 [Acetobacter cibinongensis]
MIEAENLNAGLSGQSAANVARATVYAATGGSYTVTLQNLESFAQTITSSGITKDQYSSLQQELENITKIDGAYTYVPSIFGNLMDSGIAVGTSASAFTAQIQKWFLGTDRPTALPNDSLQDKSSNSLFPTDISTAYNHIDQGYNNGDCYLVAALVETAAVNPTLLQNMITDNGNGTYGVQFYNGYGSQYVTVDSYLPGYTGAYSTDNTNWAGLIEKAYIQAQADGLAYQMAASNTYSAVANGGFDQPLKSITGKGTVTYGLSDLNALAKGGTIYQKIQYDLKNGIEVLFGSNQSTDYGLVGGHMFAVTAIDDATGCYVFNNPWGPHETSNYQFEITAAQLNSQASVNDLFLASEINNYIVRNTQVQSGLTIADGGNVAVLSGGQSFDIVLTNGNEHVSGGKAFHTTVTSGSQLTVVNGTTSGSVLENPWSAETVSAGGVAFATSALNGAGQTISAGGVASQTYASAGNIFVFSGGNLAQASAIAQGAVHLFSAGQASHTQVLSGGTEYVGDGAVSSDTVVAAGGTEHISAGGLGVGTLVSGAGASIWMDSNAQTQGAVLQAGGQQGLGAGTAYNTIVNSGGLLYVVNAAGMAVSATVNQAGSAVVTNGGVVSGVVVKNGGSITIDGGNTSNVALAAATGSVASNGVVSALTLSARATFSVDNGGIVRGGQVSDAGSWLFATSGGAG